MTPRKLGYVAAVLVAIAAAVYLRYARYNDVEVPPWMWVILAVLFVAIISFSIVSGRRQSAARRSSTDGER